MGTKYCKTCWTEIPDDADRCPHCGAPQSDSNYDVTHPEAPKQQLRSGYCPHCGSPLYGSHDYCPRCGASLAPGPVHTSIDNGGLGWGLLGCCIPIAGLILYLVWKDERPNTAKAAGSGALLCVGVTVLLYLFAFLTGIASA